MVLAEPGGVLEEVVPISSRQCRDAWARKVELRLREDIFRCEHVRDDFVAEPYFNLNWRVSVGNYGVTHETQQPETDGRRGASRWDPALKDLDRDFHKLHFRSLAVDREATMREKEKLEELFEGILPVRIRGAFWWTTGLTIVIINLIGLDGLMLAMYDNPDGLHRLMAFLRDDQLRMIEWLESEGLFTLNNENDYVGSGTQGYTTELPGPDWREGDPVRARDLWVLSESQETVGVSPQMFAEFIFPYQLPIIEKFGLSYYGCCEPVHTRWETLKTIPNLRSVSVSPWCDERIMAEGLGDRYIYCRKPHPNLVSTEHFDEDAIRQDTRRTLSIAEGCHIELVMKDVHTLTGRPERLGRWVELVREEIG